MAPNLRAWVRGPRAAASTPARRELELLLDAAAEGRRLRKEMELLREAEVGEGAALEWRFTREVHTGIALRSGGHCT
jgi:hypothetical protein